MKATMSTRPSFFPVVAVCLAVIAGTGVAGYLYLTAAKRSFYTEARNQLTAISELKVRQLTAWRAEQLSDAKALGSNPFLLSALIQSLSSGRNRAEVETWMAKLCEASGYTAVSLWDRNYRPHLWFPAGNPPHDVSRESIMQAMRGKEPILVDLHRDVPDGAVHMALAVPLLSASSPEPLGALLLSIEPKQFLYPFIQSWPVPSRSAETLLVRREGNNVVYLNELRHRKDTALKLRLPITGGELPAGRAALGYEGTLEGIDYRGVPVLAATRGVPGSPWFIVAKVDSAEVFAPLRQRLRFLAAFFVLAGLFLIGGFFLLWSRLAASAVRTSEIRYRRLFEAAKDGILILDVKTGMIVDVNPFLIELLGYSREAFLNKAIWEVGSFKDVFANQAAFLELQQKKYVRYEDLPLEAADGRRIAVEFVSNVYIEGDKKVIQCNVRDISERKRAEAALKESESVLSESQRVAHVGSWNWNLATDVMTWTPELYRVFGVSPDTFVPSVAALLSVIHQDDRAAAQAWIAACVAGKEPPALEFRVNLAGGGVRYIQGRGNLVRGAENKAIRILAIGQDITERKSLETSLLQARKMESIGRLAGGVAHDFNNLLTVINGYSALMLGNLREGDPLRASLQEIHKAGERAAHLTAQLLAFSRRQVLEPRVLDLNQLVAGMQSMLARLVGEDVVVHVGLKAEAAFVCADPTQLEQVLMNLAVNARDAMPRGGKLLIETADVERDESYAQSHAEAHVGCFIMLAVSDNGEGMDEETRRNIFEPFFTTKEVGNGTGLGLSMVHGIVAQSGGSVEVYSEPGHGTTFKIYLPRVGPEAAQDERKEAVPALRGTETVLVVEDQEGVREYAATVLGSYGYQVLKAEDAGTALAICERERVTLVLTDVVMPAMSGRELGDQLGARYPGMKVLFMSGYTDEAIARHGVLREGAQFIQKPFSPTQLAAKVREVLGPPSRVSRIVIADDEAAVRGFLRLTLEGAGYEVLEAIDGMEAVRQVRDGGVDLLLTDLVMPEQEGIETIRALRASNPAIGIIAISGAFDGQFLKTARLLGADATLLKPVTAKQLLASVAAVLQARR